MKQSETISKIKKLLNQTTEDLCDDVFTNQIGDIYFGLQSAASGLSKSIGNREDKSDMKQKLKYDLISQKDYDDWAITEEKMNVMNKDLEKEQQMRNEQIMFEHDIKKIAFHVSYMLNIFSNPSFVATSTMNMRLKWEEFNELIKKYGISNDSFIVNIIHQYNSTVETAKKNYMLKKIGIGLAVLIFYLISIKSCVNNTNY